MVVERAAAEFFEGRVLSVAESSLKVQTSDEGDPATVARSDAYRVPSLGHTYSRGQPAICEDGPSRWVACRVVGTESKDVLAELGTGEKRTFDDTEILTATPVTSLNIQRYFEIVVSRRRFAEAARSAGDPTRPGGWFPSPHEPVIAKQGPYWFSAHAAHSAGDGGLTIVWEGSARAETVPGAKVVPVPPFDHLFASGDFALVRPATEGGPWMKVVIDAVGPEEAVITAEDGEQSRVSVRHLVPLGRRHPK